MGDVMDERLEARLRADPTGDPRYIPGRFRDRIAGTAVVRVPRGQATSGLRPLGAVLAIAVVLATVIILRPVITGPAATPSPVPSAGAPSGVPTPESTPDRLSITDMITAAHAQVSAKQMQAAVLAALAADPNPWPAAMTAASVTCETGIDPDPDLAFGNGPAARNDSCTVLITELYGHYWTSGIQQDYDSTLTVYQYAVAQPIGYPDLKGPQPSDSAAKEKRDLDAFLLLIPWAAPPTAQF
jgi:hypothetical protein